MKLKLDENVDPRLASLFVGAGHDVETVYSEGLMGSPDGHILSVCKLEQRAIVTHDMDFSNVLLYPPEQCPGLIVLRLAKPTFLLMQWLAETVIDALAVEDVVGKLWIVEPGRLRVHQP